MQSRDNEALNYITVHCECYCLVDMTSCTPEFRRNLRVLQGLPWLWGIQVNFVSVLCVWPLAFLSSTVDIWNTVILCEACTWMVLWFWNTPWRVIAVQFFLWRRICKYFCLLSRLHFKPFVLKVHNFVTNMVEYFIFVLYIIYLITLSVSQTTYLRSNLYILK
jgi:hypothetical protein